MRARAVLAPSVLLALACGGPAGGLAAIDEASLRQTLEEAGWWVGDCGKDPLFGVACGGRQGARFATVVLAEGLSVEGTADIRAYLEEQGTPAHQEGRRLLSVTVHDAAAAHALVGRLFPEPVSFAEIDEDALIARLAAEGWTVTRCQRADEWDARGFGCVATGPDGRWANADVDLGAQGRWERFASDQGPAGVSGPDGAFTLQVIDPAASAEVLALFLE